jgi:hypothetical protein
MQITQRWVMIIRYQLIVIYMNKEMTTCEYDGDPRQLECPREEQCDDCFMIDLCVPKTLSVLMT